MLLDGDGRAAELQDPVVLRQQIGIAVDATPERRVQVDVDVVVRELATVDAAEQPVLVESVANVPALPAVLMNRLVHRLQQPGRWQSLRHRLELTYELRHIPAVRRALRALAPRGPELN